MINSIPLKYNLRFRNYFFSLYYLLLPTNSLDSEDIKLKNIIKDFYKDVDFHQIQIFDIGSGHPKIHSNSYYFYKKGSSTVAIDTNKNLIDLFQKKRRRDSAIFGGISSDVNAEEIIFYELSPWELSTVNYKWYKDALKGNTRLVREHLVPKLNLDVILKEYYDNSKLMHILMVDIEGETTNLINSLDLNAYKFDILLIEKDSQISSSLIKENYKLVKEDKFNYFYISNRN
jgi:hypothetical protein